MQSGTESGNTQTINSLTSFPCLNHEAKQIVKTWSFQSFFGFKIVCLSLGGSFSHFMEHLIIYLRLIKLTTQPAFGEHILHS
jgi:hypothetical protein